MKWEELPLADRSAYMREAVRNGYRDIRSIREAYNSYATGGEIEGGPTKIKGTDVYLSGNSRQVYDAKNDPDYALVYRNDKLGFSIYKTRKKDSKGNYKTYKDKQGLTYYDEQHVVQWATNDEETRKRAIEYISSHPNITDHPIPIESGISEYDTADLGPAPIYTNHSTGQVGMKQDNGPINLGSPADGSEYYSGAVTGQDVPGGNFGIPGGSPSGTVGLIPIGEGIDYMSDGPIAPVNVDTSLPPDMRFTMEEGNFNPDYSRELLDIAFSPSEYQPFEFTDFGRNNALDTSVNNDLQKTKNIVVDADLPDLELRNNSPSYAKLDMLTDMLAKEKANREFENSPEFAALPIVEKEAMRDKYIKNALVNKDEYLKDLDNPYDKSIYGQYIDSRNSSAFGGKLFGNGGDDEAISYAESRFPALIGTDFTPHKDPLFRPKEDLNGDFGDIEYMSQRYDTLPYYNDYKKPNNLLGRAVIIYNDNLADPNEAIALDAVSHGLREQDEYWQNVVLPGLTKAWEGADPGRAARARYENDVRLYGKNNIDSYEQYLANEVDGAVRSLLADPNSPNSESYSLEDNKWLLETPEMRRAWNRAERYVYNRDGHILPEVVVTPDGNYIGDSHRVYAKGGKLNDDIKSGGELPEITVTGKNKSKKRASVKELKKLDEFQKNILEAIEVATSPQNLISVNTYIPSEELKTEEMESLLDSSREKQRIGNIITKEMKRAPITSLSEPRVNPLMALQAQTALYDEKSKILESNRQYTEALNALVNPSIHAYGGNLFDTGGPEKKQSFWDELDEYASFADDALTASQLASWMNPYARVANAIGSGAVDLYQMGRSIYKGDWGDVGQNAIELALDVVGGKGIKATKNSLKVGDIIKTSPRVKSAYKRYHMAPPASRRATAGDIVEHQIYGDYVLRPLTGIANNGIHFGPKYNAPEKMQEVTLPEVVVIGKRKKKSSK